MRQRRVQRLMENTPSEIPTSSLSSSIPETQKESSIEEDIRLKRLRKFQTESNSSSPSNSTSSSNTSSKMSVLNVVEINAPTSIKNNKLSNLNNIKVEASSSPNKPSTIVKTMQLQPMEIKIHNFICQTFKVSLVSLFSYFKPYRIFFLETSRKRFHLFTKLSSRNQRN